jgi:hypothetical protein
MADAEEPHLFEHDPQVGCALKCDCAAIPDPRTDDGQVNLNAFATHIFCSTCKMEYELELDGESDISDEGNEIEVTFHGYCRGGCGKTMTISVTHYDVDLPTRREAHEQGYAVNDNADDPPAVIAVRLNRRWKEGLLR